MKYIVKHISSLNGKSVLIEREDGEIEIILEFKKPIKRREDVFEWLKDYFKDHELILPEDVWESYTKIRRSLGEEVTEE